MANYVYVCVNVDHNLAHFVPLCVCVLVVLIAKYLFSLYSMSIPLEKSHTIIVKKEKKKNKEMKCNASAIKWNKIQSEYSTEAKEAQPVAATTVVVATVATHRHSKRLQSHWIQFHFISITYCNRNSSWRITFVWLIVAAITTRTGMLIYSASERNATNWSIFCFAFF